MNKYEKKLKWIENYEYDNMEELKEIVELVERATPKKPTSMLEDDIHWLQCPKCGYDTMNDDLMKYNFCPSCGQSLDWSDEK